ncbi:hypothetical protein K2Q02_01200, partial [Patescibacteria group bacterium]|nr:hypothetical protein [Patescibacteria group bacterium]
LVAALALSACTPERPQPVATAQPVALVTRVARNVLPDEFRGRWVIPAHFPNPVIREVSVEPDGQALISVKLPTSNPFVIPMRFLRMQEVDGRDFAVFVGLGGRRTDTCFVESDKLTCSTIEDGRSFGPWGVVRPSG